MNINEMVCLQIRKRMGLQNLSQNKLAKRAQISQSGLSSILNGESSPQLDTIVRISDALNCNVIDLFFDEKEKPTIASGIKDQIADLCVAMDVTPEELQRILDFAAGIKASRKR